ncbi:MAG: 30S ribosomal protein S5 [Phycisphaerales bacterium]
MPEMIDEAGHIESTTLGIYRTASTVKGGRRFSFGALVVCGDRNGRLGFGYGKSNEVPQAIEKAQKYAKRDLIGVSRTGGTIPHEVEGRFASTKVRLIPAAPGTGVVAGGTVRAMMETVGVTDCLTKCYGSTTKLNVVKAVFDALSQIQTPAQVAELRGVEIATSVIDAKIERGKRFAPATRTGEKMRAPVNTIGQERRGGRGGGGRRRRGPGGGGDDSGSGQIQGGGQAQGGQPSEAPSAS